MDGPNTGRGALTRAFAILALVVAILAAAGAVVTYWAGGTTQMLGGLAALAALAAGTTLTLWVRGYMRQEEVEGEREPLASPEGEWDELAASLAEGRDRIGRRRLLVGGLATLAGIAMAGLVSFLRSTVGPRDPGRALRQTPWTPGTRLTRLDGSPIRRDGLPEGSMVTAFPEGHIGDLQGAVVLFHVNEGQLDLPAPQKRWAVGGLIAYSRICTHAGCPISQYEDEVHLLACPCHQSTFDILKGAVPTGGPATRPLPQLPLGVDSDGYLIAQRDFTRPVGPGFWGMPS